MEYFIIGCYTCFCYNHKDLQEITYQMTLSYISNKKKVFFPKKFFKPSSHTKMTSKYGLASMCDQNCSVQYVSRQTDRRTSRQKSKKDVQSRLEISATFKL